MAVSGETSLSRLINRLLDGPICEGQISMEDHFTILGEAIDADAFATLQIHTGKGTARILGGLGLHTPVDKWQMPLEVPRLAAHIANFSCVPALAVDGPFTDDPFLEREGVLSLLLKPVINGEMCLVTIAIRRKAKAFTTSETGRFAAVSGVTSLVRLFCLFRDEHDALKSTDELTGLGLFSDFHENMGKELSRARRGEGNVTMGIMTVVPLEPLSTDDILLDVARTFQAQLRNFDTLDRYGSMELAFILPGLRNADAVRVMDRFVGEIIASLGGEGKAPNIYVGISCYPEDGASVERLIEMAEAAMNQAFEESRPGVSRWEE